MFFFIWGCICLIPRPATIRFSGFYYVFYRGVTNFGTVAGMWYKMVETLGSLSWKKKKESFTVLVLTLNISANSIISTVTATYLLICRTSPLMTTLHVDYITHTVYLSHSLIFLYSMCASLCLSSNTKRKICSHPQKE